MNHHCHAVGCRRRVKPELLMCLKHWNLVPKALQRAVWEAYRPGQCEDMRPSFEWLKAAGEAVEAVRIQEGLPPQ
jgi:hypothetical protein